MLENIQFWLGLFGLISGIMVGISLLEEGGDAFLRNIMFSIGAACVLFIYLGQLGERSSWSPLLFLIASVIGALAALLIAFASHGNLRAALIAGGLAGVTMQVMIKILPHGSFGFTGFEDIPAAIDFLAAMLAGAGAYYVLRKWGKGGERWD
jgi:hypothetical protein